MNVINTDRYQRAFTEYLRKGTPIERSCKAGVPTSHYVWRTQRDAKVRPSHAANEGRLFSWSKPPMTGHPGDGPNCRCEAVPYIRGETEYAAHEIITDLGSSDDRWTWFHFLRHFWRGGGRTVTLTEIGYLKTVVEYYAYQEGAEGAFRRLSGQIFDRARDEGGAFAYPFNMSYDFDQVSLALGGARVEGEFHGRAETFGRYIAVDGMTTFRFHDLFTDTLDLREHFNETSDPAEVSELWRQISDGGGTHYQIVGHWRAKFRGEASLIREESAYTR